MHPPSGGSEVIQTGDPVEALTALKAHLRANPADCSAHRRAQALCERLYQFDDALSHARAAHRLDPRDVAPLVQAARMMYSRARFGEALDLLRAVTPMHSANADALVRAAEVAERAGQLEAALDYANQALHRELNHPRAIRLIAHVERRRGELSAAEARLESRLNCGMFPDRWRLHYELAAVHDRLGNYKGAFAAMLEAKHLLFAAAAPFADSTRRMWRRQRDVVYHLSRSEYLRWRHEAAQFSPRRLAVLAGHPRSGTTLLEQRLTASDDAIGTDESRVFSQEFASSLFHDAPGTAADLTSEWNSWTHEDLAAGRDTFWTLTEAILGEAAGPRLLIEKDPMSTPVLPLFVRLFPEARILMPLRHPCDIALSMWMTLVPLHRDSWAAISLETAMESVVHTWDCWRILREELPQEKREVRYESLATDPVRELADLHVFLGISPSGASSFARAHPSPRGISTPSYLEAGGAVHDRAVGRWIHYAEHIAPHAAVHSALFKSFGYDV